MLRRPIDDKGFTPDDRMGSQLVMLVNQAWAAKALPPGVDPLTERVTGIFFRRVGDGEVSDEAQIVGVVADVRYASLDKTAEPTVYISSNQWITLRRSYVVTARDGHPERLIAGLRQALRSLDPRVPVHFEMMPAIVTSSMVWSRLGFFLLATFGTIAWSSSAPVSSAFLASSPCSAAERWLCASVSAPPRKTCGG